MSVNVKIFGIAVTATILGYLGFAFANPAMTDINKIQQKDSGTRVNIRGKVISQAPFLDGGAYQIEDKTGKVWVLTQGKLPKQGEEISIEGKIEYKNIVLEQQSLGEVYLVEIGQLDRTSTSEPQTTPTPIPQDDFFLPHR
jgi:uncharacterized protein YdeI (BOF family)